MEQEPDSDLDARLAALEPAYRSRGEAQVGRLLDRYGIPFFYEQPLVILDSGRHRTWHPDYTLPTYGNMIVEYAGMPDVPEYVQGIRHKQQVYTANGIPVIFVYPRDLTGPAWPERLYDRIRETGEAAIRPRSRRVDSNPSGIPSTGGE